MKFKSANSKDSKNIFKGLFDEDEGSNPLNTSKLGKMLIGSRGNNEKSTKGKENNDNKEKL